jgi:signal transduction histidine kinase
MTIATEHVLEIETPGRDLRDGERLDVDDLRELMRAFNETTERLEATHVALRQEVARLRRELADANAQLSRSRSLAALGEMAAGIAHEIRNPLGSIQLYVQMLAEDVRGDEANVELCDKIGRAVSGLDAIVRDVLLFAREMSIRPASTNAQELFDLALHHVEGLLTAAGVEVALDVPDDGAGELYADTNLMTQAIGNIFRNAVEAMVESDATSRRIVCSAERRRVRCPDGKRAQRVVIAVRDNGPGIPGEVVDRMFNPFFTTRKTGTGLGLAIVHRIIDAHGGHVVVHNPTGGGACVELCLSPRPTPTDRSVSEPTPTSREGAHDEAPSRRQHAPENAS